MSSPEPPPREHPYGHRGSESNNPLLLSMLLLLAVTSGIFVGLRLIAKKIKRSRMWWDDALLAFAWVLVVVETFLIVSSVATDPDDPKDLRKIAIFNTLFATFAVLGWVMSRCSVALMLSQVMDGGLRALMVFIMISVSLLGFANAVFWWYKCTEVERNWLPWKKGTCTTRYTRLAVVITTSGYAALVDLVLCATPWFLIWGHILTKWERWGLFAATLLGLVGCASCVMKGIMDPQEGSVEFGKKQSAFFIWANAETALVIIAASIPVFRLLMVRMPAYSATEDDWDRAHGSEVQMVRITSMVPSNSAGRRSSSDAKVKTEPRVRFVEIAEEAGEAG